MLVISQEMQLGIPEALQKEQLVQSQRLVALLSWYPLTQPPQTFKAVQFRQVLSHGVHVPLDIKVPVEQEAH